MSTIAAGVIVSWPSTNASIPSGWSRVTALDLKHIKQIANSSTDPGTAGGSAQHHHTVPAHTHTISHTHATANLANSTGTVAVASAGSVDTNQNAHTHPTGTISATTNTSDSLAPNSDDKDIDPVRWDTIFIQSNGTPTTIPEGATVFFNSSSLPPSWTQPANGKNKLLRGAAAAGNGGGTGGGAAHNHAGGSHQHSSAHVHPDATATATATNTSESAGTLAASDAHTHVVSVTSGNFGTSVAGSYGTSGNDSPVSAPPWIKQAIITPPAGGDTLKDGLICLWLGTLANIPANWVLCSGANGTPNLCQGLYVMGCDALSEIGNTGGTTTHTHTAAAAHTHTWSSYVHTHVLSVAASAAARGLTGSTSTQAIVSHAHANSDSGAAGTVTVGTASPNSALDAAAHDPAHVQVAFIQYVSPAVSSIDGGTSTVDKKQNVAIAGTNFGATQGAGKVEVGDSATYASATKVQLPVDTWSATSIQVDVQAITTGNPLDDTFALPGTFYVFITTDGGISSGFSFTLLAVGISVTPACVSAVTSKIDPTPPAATWIEDLNTATEIDTGAGNVRLRLRVGVINSGDDIGGTDFKWRYSKNSGAYADITASSSNVKTYATNWFVDGADVPQSVTSGSYQSNNNAAEEGTGAFSLAAGLAAGARFESEIALEFVADDLDGSDIIEIRLTLGDGTPLDTYTHTPSITVAGAANVQVSPAALAAVASRINATVIFGSLSLTPSARVLIARKVDPTALLGSLSITPAARPTVTGRTNPTLILGSLSLTPAARPALTRETNPSITLGSLSITPAARPAITARANPTTVLGSVSVTPTARIAIAGKVNPSLTSGAISVTPTARGSVSRKVDPAPVLGSLAITASARGSVSREVNPTAVLGALSLTSAARTARTGRLNPSLIFGSVSITPSARSSVARAIPPTATVPVLIQPVVRSARASTINPTFAVGGVTSVTPVARSARASRINPSMIFGSVSITPAARGAVAKAINPTALGVGASWLAALNTPITVDIVTGTDFLRDELGLVTDAEGNLITVQAPGGPNARVRLRVGIHNTSAILGASGFKWQFRVNAGTWTDLTSSSAHIRTFDSAYFADGDDVPQSITSGSYQANNNAAVESTGEFTLAAGLAGGFYFETELALEIIGADVSLTNDTLDFRIVLASGALLNTYSQVPQLLARLVSVTLVRPAAVSAKTGRVGPTAVFGSLSLSPAARTARVSRINPTVTAGSPIAVTPATRTSRASRTNPTFVYGALSLHPVARTARGQSTAPTVIRGSILLTAIVSAKTRTTNPAIQFSSMAVSPQAISAIAGKTNPFVAIANVIVQPQAVASRARSSNPSIILGNVSTAPATATARTSTTDPIVFLASTLVTPLAVRTRASSIAPAVQIIGSTSITAVVTTKTSLVNPTFSYGSLSIASVATRALTSRISPSVLYGSTTITAVTSARTGLIDPAIRLGDATLVAAPAVAVTSTRTQAVVIANVMVEPAAARAVSSLIAPTIALSSTSAAPSALSTRSETTNPVVHQGSLQLSPQLAGATVNTFSPTVVLGSVAMTPLARQAIARVLMQEIGLSSMVVGPSNVACLVSSTIADVHIQFADVPVTPAVAFSIASTVDPLTAIYTKPVSVMSLMTAGGVVRLEVNRSVLQLTVESDTIKLKAA